MRKCLYFLTDSTIVYTSVYTAKHRITVELTISSSNFSNAEIDSSDIGNCFIAPRVTFSLETFVSNQKNVEHTHCTTQNTSFIGHWNFQVTFKSIKIRLNIAFRYVISKNIDMFNQKLTFFCVQCQIALLTAVINCCRLRS